MRRVIVVGAGASGLMASIWAARMGAQVTLLEGMDRPGKKLLITGNGRCNLTNLNPQLSKTYYGSGSAAARLLTERYSAKELLTFFRELGLLTQEKNGYVYPYSGQAQSVLEVLLTELRRCGVKLKLSEKIQTVQPAQGKWQVSTASWTYEADAVILACGSCAAPLTGSDGSGYTIASSLGVKLIPPRPALTAVLCKESYLPGLAGVRSKASVSLIQNGQKRKTECGELQWISNGVSGIVVFQISRFVSCAEKEDRLSLELDLLPDFCTEELYDMLRIRRDMIPEERISVLFDGIIHEKLMSVILELTEKKQKGSKLRKMRCKDLSEEQLKQILAKCKQFSLTVCGTRSFDASQVCAGGVEASEVNPETMELTRHKGLYIAGELLDVDGPCGGYNLQWAWSSGYAAGCAAAAEKS